MSYRLLACTVWLGYSKQSCSSREIAHRTGDSFMFHYTIVSGAMVLGRNCDRTWVSSGQTDGRLVAECLRLWADLTGLAANICYLACIQAIY